MSAIDILILAVGGCALVLGYIRGIVAQVGQIVAVVAGVVVSRMFGPVLSGFFAGGGATSPGTDISGYIVAFVAAYLAVWLIFRLARRTVHGLPLGIVDRAAGAVFKAALWLLALSMALNVWMLVRGDVMRGRFRDGFSRPKAFTPGVPARVPFRMTDIAHTFRAGHRVMIQVQSTWFPLAERSPQQFVDVWTCGASDFVPCKVSVLHQRSNSSSVTVWRLGES